MKILLANQAFYPDIVATAYHASDLALTLASRGHDISVITSRRSYDAPYTRFPKNEVWRGIRISRLWSPGSGKASVLRRLAEWASFYVSAAIYLAHKSDYDLVIALTSPPLIAAMLALFSTGKHSAMAYWVMDLNPDQAIAAGLLRPSSPVARILEKTLLYTLRRSARIIVLDRFMRNRLIAKGADPARCEIIAPGSLDDKVRYDPEGRNVFRQRHHFADKFVIMYSGNHSPCHPLDTLLEAAKRFAAHQQIVFCFVGGGTEHRRVRDYAKLHGLMNIVALPYQATTDLSSSLCAADLHVAVLGNHFRGIVHPCKIYNILKLGVPVLYIGPSPSHVTDLVPKAAEEDWFFSARHGDVDAVAHYIQRAFLNRDQMTLGTPRVSTLHFSKEYVMQQIVRSIESIDQQRIALNRPAGYPDTSCG